MKIYLLEFVQFFKKKMFFSFGRKIEKFEVNVEKNLKCYLYYKGICLYNL